ncbi:hypothetical protein HVZ46_20050 [Citrobacter freundii]|uniref:hypothetical protein n=1 Tax=Citrobacter freundii TaxID=546 RepID=UPI0015E9CB40|nr:hypothetical protein [Citrobacter freundii]QMD26711.1 hypothetical protein HVZ46_20050 [Citrobacter freundii]
MKLFAILDIDHPMVAWEVAIGRVLANPITDVEGVEYPTPSLWLYNNINSSIKDKFMSDLQSEFYIEKIRATKFPGKPSRLNGAFFFESKEDAVNACKMWEWENKMDYISEVDFNETSYVKLDSNWITLRIRCCEKSELDGFIEKYYGGEELFSGKPLNEIICTGSGKVLNAELRRMAYKKILQKKPDASLLLALGISCYEQDARKYQDIFRVSPFIQKTNDGNIEGSFITSLRHLDEDEKGVGKLAKRYIHNNGTALITPKLNRLGVPLRIIRPLNQDTFFSLDDLSPYFFRIPENDYMEMMR